MRAQLRMRGRRRGTYTPMYTPEGECQPRHHRAPVLPRMETPFERQVHSYYLGRLHSLAADRTAALSRGLDAGQVCQPAGRAQ